MWRWVPPERTISTARYRRRGDEAARLRCWPNGLTTPGESYAFENARLEMHRPRIGSSHGLRRESVIRAAERRILF